jgi:hypothetical protein
VLQSQQSSYFHTENLPFEKFYTFVRVLPQGKSEWNFLVSDFTAKNFPVNSFPMRKSFKQGEGEETFSQLFSENLFGKIVFRR